MNSKETIEKLEGVIEYQKYVIQKLQEDVEKLTKTYADAVKFKLELPIDFDLLKDHKDHLKVDKTLLRIAKQNAAASDVACLMAIGALDLSRSYEMLRPFIRALTIVLANAAVTDQGYIMPMMALFEIAAQRKDLPTMLIPQLRKYISTPSRDHVNWCDYHIARCFYLDFPENSYKFVLDRVNGIGPVAQVKSCKLALAHLCKTCPAWNAKFGIYLEEEPKGSKGGVQ